MFVCMSRPWIRSIYQSICKGGTKIGWFVPLMCSDGYAMLFYTKARCIGTRCQYEIGWKEISSIGIGSLRLRLGSHSSSEAWSCVCVSVGIYSQLHLAVWSDLIWSDLICVAFLAVSCSVIRIGPILHMCDSWWHEIDTDVGRDIVWLLRFLLV